MVEDSSTPSLTGSELDALKPRLRRLVELRLDPRLRGRVDPSDVLQETFLKAVRRYKEFLRDTDVSLYVWIRFLALQELQQQHRSHFSLKKRDVRREQPRRYGEEASVVKLVEHIAGDDTSPSGVAIRAERSEALRRALAALAPEERELLALRYYEQLSNAETATILGLTPSATSSRYVRALARLGRLLSTHKDGDA